ncbi:Hypothetical_protein [Hexamita inflata]|uniref:Hypothetical_protein n=1 Tax=Hexamita inflata TaxID=28002 RepID=A0AA86QXE4_9EUKA|nr:Hypothetical protein HINF_LOCUS49253 [Hexamita inflata]
MLNLPNFSLFGLTDNISTLNTNISVKVPQQLSQGSLLCFICDVTANSSDFTFVASGQNISGAVQSPLTTFKLNQSLVQFRLNGVNVGGLLLNASTSVITVSYCNISGYISQESVSGSIVCFVIEHVSLEVDNVRICSNTQNIGSFGQGSLTQTGTFTVTCVVCREGMSAYGLCQNNLEFGEVDDDKFVCPNPFIFDGERCSCKEGNVINGTTCVNILASVNLLNSQQIEINNSLVDLSNRTKTIENLSGILNISLVQIDLDIQSLYLLNNQTQNNIIANSTQLQQYLLENYSKTENYLQTNTTVLDWRILNNVTILNNQISTLNNYSIVLNENITQLNKSINQQKDLNQLLSQNITQLNQTLIQSNEVIHQQQQIINSLSVLVDCLNYVGQYNVSGSCYMVDVDDSLSCSQKVYQQAFDISVVTHQVINTANFSKNYVFSSTNVIRNAFIDIFDGVYSINIYPLFSSQNTFTNVKIQFGAQSLNDGSFISTQNSFITINQMNIISKLGSQLTVNANYQLNIIANSPTGANINNLLVNLSFGSSYGNITLINNTNGVFNISGYEVLGDYNSVLIVAMIGINVQTSTININQVNFKPNIYNVGNSSSYLFSNSIFYASTFMINNFAVLIGNKSNFLLQGSLSTNTFNTNYYQFGGIIAVINSASLVSVNNVIVDSYQKFSTGYVSYSGFLVGNIQVTSSNITIMNLCLQQNMASTTIQFNSFGLIGKNLGNSSIMNASVTFSVQGAYFWDFGMIGLQDPSSLYAEVINARVSVKISDFSNGGCIGSLFGGESAKNCSILNTSVIQGNISASLTSNNVGGLIGNLLQNISIFNSTITNSNVSGANFVGGLFGNQNQNTTVIDSVVDSVNISGQSVIGGIIGASWSKLYLTSVKIQFVYIQGVGSDFGVVIGSNQGGTFSFTNSVSLNNFVNGNLQKNCSLLNSQPVSGC